MISYPYADATPGAQVSTFVANKNSEAATVEAFQQALTKAREAAAGDEDLIREAVASYTKIEGDALTNMILPDFSTARTPDADQAVADALLKYGFIPEALSVEDLLFKGN